AQRPLNPPPNSASPLVPAVLCHLLANHRLLQRFSPPAYQLPVCRSKGTNAMNEKTIDQMEEEVLSYEVSDEAVEAAGTRTEIAGAWTFVCTGGIQCNHNVSDGGRTGQDSSSILQAGFWLKKNPQQTNALEGAPHGR